MRSSPLASAILDALLAPQPRVTAMTTPRLATAMDRTARAHRSGMMTSVRESAMNVTVGSPDDASHGQTGVQCGARLRKCRTSAQVEALAALRTLAEPFSIRGAADTLGWDYSEASHWIGELSARGYLVASRSGHTWTEAGRSA